MALVFNIFTFNMLEVFAKTDEVKFSADSSDFVLLSDELVQKGYRLKIYDAYRTQMAVNNFMNWALDVNDVRYIEKSWGKFIDYNLFCILLDK